ncbi:MAG TPA: hypothetical protein VJA16_04595 [Thermoanaerobaculia bacterium]
MHDMLEAARKIIRYTGSRKVEDTLDNATLWKIVRTDVVQVLGLLERIEKELS